jgi:hypothetical protein
MGQAWWCVSVIPATQEVEIRRITVQRQARQKVTKTSISTNKSELMVPSCRSNYWGGKGGRIEVQSGQGKNMRPYLKNS